MKTHKLFLVIFFSNRRDFKRHIKVGCSCDPASLTPNKPLLQFSPFSPSLESFVSQLAGDTSRLSTPPSLLLSPVFLPSKPLFLHSPFSIASRPIAHAMMFTHMISKSLFPVLSSFLVITISFVSSKVMCPNSTCVLFRNHVLIHINATAILQFLGLRIMDTDSFFDFSSSYSHG